MNLCEAAGIGLALATAPRRNAVGFVLLRRTAYRLRNEAPALHGLLAPEDLCNQLAQALLVDPAGIDAFVIADQAAWVENRSWFEDMRELNTVPAVIKKRFL